MRGQNIQKCNLFVAFLIKTRLSNGRLFRKKSDWEQLGGGMGVRFSCQYQNERRFYEVKSTFSVQNFMLRACPFFFNSLVCYLACRLLEPAGAIGLILASRSVYESTEKVGASFNQYFLNWKMWSFLSKEQYYSKKTNQKIRFDFNFNLP